MLFVLFIILRFYRQLIHIILYNPSWYVLASLEEQQRTRKPTLYWWVSDKLFV